MKTDEPINQGDKLQKSEGTEAETPKKMLKILTHATLIVSIILFFGISIAFLVAQNANRKEVETLNSDKEFMTSIIHTRDSLIGNYESTLDEIDSSLEVLNKRHRILVAESEGNELAIDRRKKILQDIQFMNYMLDDNKKQIAELTKKIASSGVKTSRYEKRLTALNKTINGMDSSISQLKQQLASKDFEIAQLNLKVNSMDNQIKTQTSQITNMSTQLSNLDEELNRAYVISGTYKQLRDKGVLTRTGGLLGIGGNVRMASGFAEKSFEPIDIRQTKSIPVAAKKVEFITNHPTDSYHWVKKENKIESLVITDPNKFWKYTKYAVLETR